MDNFSKWNKRITSYILILIGVYMGIMKYEVTYVIIFLGTGLLNIGMAIYFNLKNSVKIGDHPPPDDDPPPGGN